MARRRKGFFDDLASLPWPVGIATGLIIYAAIRYGVPWYMSGTDSGLGAAFANGQIGTSLGWLAWTLLAVCWLAAAASFFSGRQRARLFDSQASSPQLASLNWREFEQLVGEWFRRRGYSVEETGGGGSDGGIDLVVRKNGRRELVQCKHWKRKKVDVATVREMWGLQQHHGADAVWIVCMGEFTSDASRFAAGKPIKLVSGHQLNSLIGYAPTATGAQILEQESSSSAKAAACPKCGSPMTSRKNRATGKSFLGCTSYPRCRETRESTS